MWCYEQDLNGVLGVADGYLELKAGVLLSDFDSLSEQQKKHLQDSNKWHYTPPVKKQDSLDPLNEEKTEKPKKRRGRKPAVKKD